MVYIQQGIELEGLRDKVLLNVVYFESKDDVLADFAEHRIPKLRELAHSPRTTRIMEPNLQSPLGQVQFPPLSLEPQPINPDFIVGVQVTPWSFGDSAPPFDGSRIEEISRVVQDAEPADAEPLAPKTERLGVRFASAHPNKRRTDGSPKQPTRQVLVWRDARVTLRFRTGRWFAVRPDNRNVVRSVRAFEGGVCDDGPRAASAFSIARSAARRSRALRACDTGERRRIVRS